jgi:putative transposase
VIEECFDELCPLVGTAGACRGVGRSRATHYRRANPGRATANMPRSAPKNKLTSAEADAVLDVLHSERFCDASPAQVYFTLLDEGVYLASESTYYRLLRSRGEVHERRRQATHPPRVRPELVATRPLVVWSWDITKLKGPTRGVTYDLYVVMDIFSRYVVAWCVAPTESGELAKDLIADAVARHQIPPDQLTVHADRGSSMTSRPVTELYSFLGISRSHSRPHVSNDNPFSEAGFKTLKYCPAFPGRFGSIHDAREFCERFFTHYNYAHRHSGIGYHTPASVHFGTAAEIRDQRARTLEAAFEENPIRFRNRPPTPPTMPATVWINEPLREEDLLQKIS